MIMLIENHKVLLKFLISLVLITSVFVYPTLSEPTINITKTQVARKEGKSKMGNIYYVDAAKGGDSNDGLSPEKAWKTIEKANSVKLNPGDSVLLKRGNVWREQLIPQSGDETGYITYGAYGDDDKPMLLGSVTRNNTGDWVHEGHNIWTTIMPELVGDELLPNPSFETDTNGWHLYCEGNADAVGNRDTSDYDSSPASYKVECMTNNGAVNHIQLYTTDVSIEQGHYYKLSFRAKGTEEFTIDDISLMKPNAPWASYYSYRSSSQLNIKKNWATYEVLFKASETASDARITVFLGKSLPERVAFRIDSVSFRRFLTDNMLPVDVGNLIFNNEESFGIKVWNQTDMDSQDKFWYDENNWVLKMYSETNPAVYYSSIECALRRHIIDESGKSYVIYENLELRYGGAHGIGGGSTHHIIVRNCNLSYIGGGDQMGGDRTVRFGNGIEFWENAHDNLVEGCKLWEIYDAALTNQGSQDNSQINIHYRNNIIWNCEYSFEYWNRGEESTTSRIYFENNICLNAGYGWGHNQRPDPNGRHLMFYTNTAKTSEFYVRRNIFYEATESCLRLGNDWSSSLNMDYNCWHQSHGTMIKWMSDEYTMDQFSKYQAEKGQDRHSIASDPRFVDVGSHDFRPASGSPVLNHPGIGAILADSEKKSQ